ncbi:hypothetical protein NOR_07921 [Metarhizium rileyi]|uniref:Uncharacterized protein n=1 Tax=Metarhizium rileyi (strain RCEF 4871) TaxID=1649241 RepID=A0A166X8H5_METRR|nr:hypothetical protein NOR_07921 [Metarhizium rileyi RCEF 4871]TWU71236.1 hypothetical protein ED733_001733 [Metarhizium rileyi]
MKSSFVAVVLSFFAGAALALPAGAPTATLDDRQMKVARILHNNKDALGLTKDETAKFDRFMAGTHKRSPQGILGGLTGSLSGGNQDPDQELEDPAADAVPSGTPTDGAPESEPSTPPKEGGILGGSLLPGVL